MQIFRSSEAARGRLTAPAVAIGNFDGVHLGHQELLSRARDLAEQESGQAVVLTFEPHPARLFNPDLAPPLLTTEEQKLELLRSKGVAAVVVQPFDADFASLTPDRFVRRMLVEDIGAGHVVVGRDFVFGKGRQGTVRTLKTMGAELGFVAHGVRPVRAHGIVASSTKVRNFVLMGKVRGAAMLLGREYSINGLVVQGKQRGRTIGVPTANVQTDNEILPKRGVYAGYGRLQTGDVVPAVINVGTNPTFEKGNVVSLEAHLLDFEADLYRQQLEVSFSKRLREERRYSDVQQLIDAIAGDIAQAREILEI